MKAVILAGGQGTRLRPYTTVFPKPLMPIGDMPILEVVLRQLRRAGVEHVTLAVSYLAELIQAYCGTGERFGLTIAYSRETKPLSTAGPLKLIPGLTETFLAMNGDVLTTLDYGDLVAFHRQRGATATIATYRRQVKIDFGVVESGPDQTLARYIEKPQYEYTVSMGVNVLEPRALDFIADGESLGMPDLFLRLREAGLQVATYPCSGRWLDIGRQDDYAEAVDLFAARRAEFLPGETG